MSHSGSQPFFSEKPTPQRQTMNSITSIRRSFGVLFLALFALCAPVQGQALADMHKEALDSMKAGKWPEAHAVLVKATNTYDGRALQLFGPSFGWFWYHRGYCEIKLNMFDDAIKSFDKCYTKYKNVAPKEGQAPSNNMYNKKSLLMWGHAAKGAEEWATSIRMYKKFLEERDPARDGYEKGVFYINMAINHYKLKKITEGNSNLETAIKGKVIFPTPNKGIMAAFNVMVAAVIEKKDENALLDFLAKNRAHIKLEPFEAHEFSPLFMKLAQDARSAEMIRSTFELYSLVPSTVAAIDDIKARLAMLATFDRTIRDGSMIVAKPDLSQSLTDLEKADASGKVNEIYAYLNTAVLHEEAGNIRGAFAVYEQLELYFPKAKIYRDKKEEPARESNLYNLVRTSAVIGEVLTTEHYGSIFLKAFPESKHVKEVRRMMLTSLFFNGEYAKCVEVAEIMLPRLTKPSKQHDVCLFVLGGSKHYLGMFMDAQPLLNEYVDTYKKSKEGDKLRVQAASYFHAANYSRLQEWSRSASLLDDFLKEYPDPKSNLYFPFALFDRANCHYAENELEPAFEKVTRVETEFPGVSVMEQTLALKGNILEGLKKPGEAEEYYLKALALAEQKKNDLVSGECLFYLTALIGKEKIGKEENPRVAEAVPYYTKFWDKYGADSPFKAKVAVAGIPGMRKVGKIEEALELLQGVIADLSKIKGTPGLEGAIGSYTEEYLIEHTEDQLKDHYYAFPRIDSRDMATRALLRIAIIDVFEGVYATADKEKDEGKARDAKARIDVLFKELRDDFNPKDLSNFILVKVGHFIRKNTTQPEVARIYYEEALNRPNDQSHKFAAIFGLADVNAKGTKSQQLEAIKLLKRVIDDSDEDAEKEEALFLTASIHADAGDYDAAIATAKEYINNKKFRQYTVPARMLLAAAHEQAGRADDAIVAYQQVWSTSMGAFRYSAPAMQRWMKILWDRGGNNKSGKTDKQYAYEGGYEYIKLTVNAAKKATPDERALRDQVAELVKDYEANSETTAVVEEEK
ncbi:MAG: tetratricopeptide (TPR) repeat protein [Paracoccaceae bacterium]|jgi:tetratricopeptide (TPR) repeat protein